MISAVVTLALFYGYAEGVKLITVRKVKATPLSTHAIRMFVKDASLISLQ